MEFIFCSVFDQTVFGDLHIISERLLRTTIRVPNINMQEKERKDQE
jgi:hypothetical protein